jgi:cytochrome b561
MTEKNNNEYSKVAKTLHWLIAILLIAEWMIGTTLDTTSWYGLHFQTGSLILILVLIRIIWKVVAGHPPMDSSLSSMNKLAATFGHSVLYLLMLLVPILGLILVFTHGEPISL